MGARGCARGHAREETRRVPRQRRGFAASPRPTSTNKALRDALQLEWPRGPLGSRKKSLRGQKKLPKSLFLRNNVYLCRRDPGKPLLAQNNMEQIKCTMKAKGLRMECDRNEFALALKTWRLRSALTQSEAGKVFGVSRYTIMRAEAGKQLTWEMAYKLFARLSDQLVKERQQ